MNQRLALILFLVANGCSSTAPTCASDKDCEAIAHCNTVIGACFENADAGTPFTSTSGGSSGTSTSSTTSSTGASNSSTSGTTTSSSSAGSSNTSSGGGSGSSGSVFAIASFSATPSQVVFGESARLSWTVTGQPTSLTLSDDISGHPSTAVIGQTTTTVTPFRRQTFTLNGSVGQITNSRTITVTARGLDLLAGAPSAGGADGIGAMARFSGPTFGALDSNGNLLITDSSGHTIRKIEPNGHTVTVAGQFGQAGYRDGPTTTALFNYPTGIALDPQGNIYISEVENKTVRKISATGMVSTLAGEPGVSGNSDGAGIAAHFNNPNALVLNSLGNLFLADTFNHVIRQIDLAGNVTTVVGRATNSGAADGQGTQARLNGPNGLAIDASDNIYVVDTFNNNLRKIDAQLNVTTISGVTGVSGSVDGPAHSATYNNPSCVAVDPSGVLFIADTNNYTIRKIDLNHTVSTIAGVSGHQGVQLGPLPAQLNNIYGLTLTPAGDLYILSENQVLQLTTP